MQTEIGLILIKDNAILLVQRNDQWILPSGRPFHDESEEACLMREMGEKMPDAVVRVGEHYEDFEGRDHQSSDSLTIITYLGEIDGDTTSASESFEVRPYSRDDFADIKIPNIVLDILKKLIEDQFLR